MPYENADNQTYESCEEATGREYLFREVCGAAALPAGEGGAFGGRSVRTNGDSPLYPVQLGVRESRTLPQFLPDSCRCAFGKYPYSDTGKIENWAFLKNKNTPYLQKIRMCYTISRPVRREFSNTEKSALCTLVALARSFDWTSKQKRVFHVHTEKEGRA